jgi:aminopeptidase
MATTLFDENRGGKYGNMHVAIGSAYKDCFQGDEIPQTATEWDQLGFNESVVHEDIVSTTNRTVVARTSTGKEITIYKDGIFLV